MNLTRLGPLDGVSRLTLGGGGLGRIWGETSIDEAVATVHAAVAGGITLIDTAPMYRDCEQVIDEAFAGALPPGVRITTKHQLGSPPIADVADRLEASLENSLRAMRLKRADIFSCTATSPPTATSIFATPSARRASLPRGAFTWRRCSRPWRA